jgi:hypothetical protein
VVSLTKDLEPVRILLEFVSLQDEWFDLCERHVCATVLMQLFKKKPRNIPTPDAKSFSSGPLAARQQARAHNSDTP